jgi:cytochrome c oxidase subunit 2
MLNTGSVVVRGGGSGKGRRYDARALRPDRILSRRRALALGLLAAAALLLLLSPSALADVVTPEDGGSPNADDIDTLYKVVLVPAIIIFIGVEGALIWALVKYRRRRGGPEALQLRGNTPLEFGWTVGAAVIVAAIAALAFFNLNDIKNPPRSGPGGLETAKGVQFASLNQPSPPGGGGLTIGVNGQQYIWRYDYAGRQQLFSYYEMVVPINTTVLLKITSSDVAHSWWIPKLGGKFDALPGHTNETWFKIPKPGIYDGQCAELCGDNHADMRARVRAVPVDEFTAWAERQAADIRASQQGLSEQRKRREAQEPEQKPSSPTTQTE